MTGSAEQNATRFNAGNRKARCEAEPGDLPTTTTEAVQEQLSIQ